MTKNEFACIVRSVEASEVHKMIYVEAGFVAVTTGCRDVIHERDNFEEAKRTLHFHNIKIMYGKENDNQGSEA